MAYWLTGFAGLTVPTALGDRGSMDIAAGQADAPLVQLPGGRVFDPLGSDPAYRPSAQYTCRVLIVSNTPTTIKTVLDTWQAAIGTVGTLTRTPDNAATAQTITARLLSASVNRTLMGSRIVPLTLVFQAIALPWSGTVHTATALTKATISGHDYISALVNAGNAAQSVVSLSFTPAAGTTMSALTFFNDAGKTCQYNANVTAGHVLLIKTGPRTVTNNAVADYANFVPPTTSEFWFLLAAGGDHLNYNINFAGGTGVDVAATYTDAWA